MAEHKATPERVREQTTKLAPSDVAPGELAVVDEVTDHEGPVGRRLSDFGFLPGTEVLVVRRAPLRDPTIYQLRGNQMCLRKAEAQRIIVSWSNPVATSGDPLDRE